VALQPSNRASVSLWRSSDRWDVGTHTTPQKGQSSSGDCSKILVAKSVSPSFRPECVGVVPPVRLLRAVARGNPLFCWPTRRPLSSQKILVVVALPPRLVRSAGTQIKSHRRQCLSGVTMAGSQLWTQSPRASHAGPLDPRPLISGSGRSNRGLPERPGPCGRTTARRTFPRAVWPRVCLTPLEVCFAEVSGGAQTPRVVDEGTPFPPGNVPGGGPGRARVDYRIPKPAMASGPKVTFAANVLVERTPETEREPTPCVRPLCVCGRRPAISLSVVEARLEGGQPKLPTHITQCRTPSGERSQPKLPH
jgi:hypothetical protein